MSKIPQTDSIAELARFWDTHDLTDFESELVEVTEPVFERSEKILHISLHSRQASAKALRFFGSSCSTWA